MPVSDLLCPADMLISEEAAKTRMFLGSTAKRSSEPGQGFLKDCFAFFLGNTEGIKGKHNFQ